MGIGLSDRGDTFMVETKKSPKENDESAEFYEMIAASRPGYAYFPYVDDGDKEKIQATPDSSKTTAIITLVLVGIAALAIGVLIMRGLDTIKSTIPPPNDSTGTLEL